MSRYHTRHALARARGALSRTKRTTALLAGLAATGATAAAMILPGSSASAIDVHGIYLNSNPRLALAAPNKVVDGSAAQLKGCNANVPPVFDDFGWCALDANIKLSEQFRFQFHSGILFILNQNGLCLTNRSKGGPVTFETCGNVGTGFASQQWEPACPDGSALLGDLMTTPGLRGFVIQNVKTGGNLSPVSQPVEHTPVTTTDGRWTWGVSRDFSTGVTGGAPACATATASPSPLAS